MSSSSKGWGARSRGGARLRRRGDAAHAGGRGRADGAGAHSVYRLIESGAVHWAGAPGELLLICLSSLLEQSGHTSSSE